MTEAVFGAIVNQVFGTIANQVFGLDTSTSQFIDCINVSMSVLLISSSVHLTFY